jgi:hypothetical protein
MEWATSVQIHLEVVAINIQPPSEEGKRDDTAHSRQIDG